MLTVYDVKNYIRCDDDDEQVMSLMEAADSYLADAIDDFSNVYATAGKAWQAKADLAKKLLIADWYENREQLARPVGSAVQLLITQLQLVKHDETE